MSERESIGHILRQRREERGLSIEQAAFQSKVPLRLLQALEADDYHLLPDALYLIRLLHDIAVFLKLEPAALEAEFRSAIRRPVRQTLAVAPPPPPPPTIPWKQVIWTLAAIVVITPLVFIALSLTSRRERETPGPSRLAVTEPALERLPAEGDGAVVADRFLAMHPGAGQPGADTAPGPTPKAAGESPEPVGVDKLASPEGLPPAPAVSPGQAVSPSGVPEAGSTAQATTPVRGNPGSTPAAGPESPLARRAAAPPGPASSAVEGTPRRFLLTARALEPTWMSVRADGGERRQILLQTGQVARFVADTGFVVTLGNAGGVDLTLNGARMPSPGKSGQVIRDLAIPAVEKLPGSPGAPTPRESRQTVE